MLVCTTWKARQLSREQANRMMMVWGNLEASLAVDPSVERLCWYIFSDGSGGMTVSRFTDPEVAASNELSTSLALSEFLEFESRVVLDLQTAMPAIVKGLEHINS
jgi:hypothetical protein